MPDSLRTDQAITDGEHAAPVGRRSAFSLACSVPWAILPDALQTVLEIAARENPSPQAVAAELGRPLDHTHRVTLRDGVAVIPVTGPVFRRANLFTEVSGATSIEMLATDLRQALSDPTVKAILLDIDSPGGEVNGVQEFAEMVYRARKRKPVAAYISHLGASAAYWIASAADEIVLAETAAAGSIGVLAAVRKPGSESARDIQFVSSQSPHKVVDPTTETGRSRIQQMIDHLGDVFVETVARNRDVSTETVLADFGQGGVLIGRHAVAAGLADRLGSFEDTVAALQERTRPAVLGGVMGIRESWEAFKAALTPQEMAAVIEPATGGATATSAGVLVPQAVPGVGGVLTINADWEPVADERIKALEAELAQTKAQAAARETAVEQATARIAAMEAAARRERFTAEVMGRSDANGHRWVGPPDKHIAMLERLATQFGEDSEAVADYLELNRAHAAQMQQSGLLAEIGRDGSDSAQAPASQLLAKARQVAAERSISVEEATGIVAAQEPALYAAHAADMRQRRG